MIARARAGARAFSGIDFAPLVEENVSFVVDDFIGDSIGRHDIHFLIVKFVPLVIVWIFACGCVMSCLQCITLLSLDK